MPMETRFLRAPRVPAHAGGSEALAGLTHKLACMMQNKL